MLKKLTIFTALMFSLSLFHFDKANAQSADGFNRLKAAGSGVGGGEGDGKSSGEDDGKGGKGGSSSGGAQKSGRLDGKAASENDILFLGVFETYVPAKRFNANLTVFAEPRKFLLGHRACMRMDRIRDQINQYLFSNPPKLDKRGVAETEGMDNGVREAIKAALKTKLEYFTSIYVVSGRYSLHKIPSELDGQTVTDCAGMIAAKAEMDKAKK